MCAASVLCLRRTCVTAESCFRDVAASAEEPSHEQITSRKKGVINIVTANSIMLRSLLSFVVDLELRYASTLAATYCTNTLLTMRYCDKYRSSQASSPGASTSGVNSHALLNRNWPCSATQVGNAQTSTVYLARLPPPLSSAARLHAPRSSTAAGPCPQGTT